VRDSDREIRSLEIIDVKKGERTPDYLNRPLSLSLSLSLSLADSRAIILRAKIAKIKREFGVKDASR